MTQEKTRPRISVTVICLNEEANIRGCLESAQWADEIIVSDSGSTDRTREICAEYGAVIHVDAWLGFGAQKNLCDSRAKGEWILNIDADERVTPELRDEILGIIEAPDSVNGYYMPRRNYFGERRVRHCGWWPDYNLRLYKAGSGRWIERRVHEAVEVTGPVGRTKGALIHRTYKDVDDYMRRMQRYSTLAAEQMREEGRHASIIDILFRPVFTFFKMYIIKLGFLDGGLGIMLSRLYASYTLLKYTKLREMDRAAKRP